MMLTYPFPSSLNQEPAFSLHPTHTPINLHLSIRPILFLLANPRYVREKFEHSYIPKVLWFYSKMFAPIFTRILAELQHKLIFPSGFV
jgi:hypothetical protein